MSLIFGTNYSSNYLGYIKHDDFWMFKSEFINAFNALQKIIMTKHKLYFPYMSTSKENIIRKLYEYEIYDLTWHCEEPTEDLKACGRCTPCKKHKEALLNIKKEDEEHLPRLIEEVEERSLEHA